MLNLSIPIPDVPGQQDIEIEMNVSGSRRKIRYRVEVVEWKDCRVPDASRADCIRDLLQEYDKDWVVYNIGKPSRDFVPLTFIRKEDWVAQQWWLWRKR